MESLFGNKPEHHKLNTEILEETGNPDAGVSPDSDLESIRGFEDMGFENDVDPALEKADAEAVEEVKSLEEKN